MTDVNQLMEVLLDIREDLGELKAAVKNFEHVSGRVRYLELSNARQKGAARVWHTVTAAMGGVLGFLASYFGPHH